MSSLPAPFPKHCFCLLFYRENRFADRRIFCLFVSNLKMQGFIAESRPAVGPSPPEGPFPCPPSDAARCILRDMHRMLLYISPGSLSRGRGGTPLSGRKGAGLPARFSCIFPRKSERIKKKMAPGGLVRTMLPGRRPVSCKEASPCLFPFAGP